MRAYLIDTHNNEAKAIDVRPALDEYYRLIGCRCVDFPRREIDGHPYNIICDDEGLLKPNRVSAVSRERDIYGSHERLAGNLLIFGCDPNDYEHGNRALTDDEVRQLESSVRYDGACPVLFYTGW